MNWKSYWTSYPKKFGRTEYLRQVKNTVGGKPVSDAVIIDSVEAICSRLELKPQDTLLDLCCGNGVISKKLAQNCSSVIGVDFSEVLVDIAKNDHVAPNISYLCMNVLDFPGLHYAAAEKFTKIVMISGLQYLKVSELPLLMRVISNNLDKGGIALLTAVPDRMRKATFYNTPWRRLRHEWQRMRGCDQMGTWWHRGMIQKMCKAYNLDCSFLNAGQAGLSYRFDLKITWMKI